MSCYPFFKEKFDIESESTSLYIWTFIYIWRLVKYEKLFKDFFVHRLAS